MKSSSCALRLVGLPSITLLAVVAVLAKESRIVVERMFHTFTTIHLVTVEVEHIAEVGGKVAEALHLALRTAGDPAAVRFGDVEKTEDICIGTWNSMWAGGSAALAAGAMLSAQKLVLTW